MRFSFWIPNTISWAETLAAGVHAEQVGYDGLWYADHFMPNTPEPSDGPVHEAFTALAALAAAVPRVRLGPLVAGNTYRNPAVAAKTAATIDHISGGRFVFGLGAGWQENEHRAYGLQFESFRWRFDRLEEACQIITSLFAGGRTNFAGQHYTMVEAPLDPSPVQTPLPLLIGGGGEKRTLPIVARYAQEWNVWGTPEILAQKGEVLGRCLEAVGKDPRSVQRSAVALLFLSDDTDYLAKMRSRDIGRPAMIGNPAELQDLMGQYRDAGVDEVIVPGFNLKAGAETEDITARFIEEVAAPFRN